MAGTMTWVMSRDGMEEPFHVQFILRTVPPYRGYRFATPVEQKIDALRLGEYLHRLGLSFLADF